MADAIPLFLTEVQHGRVSGEKEYLARPNCSYSCLIGMALKSSRTGRMTVANIYTYIQNKFSYFKNCPHNTWKNSVRHSLSLSRNFQRVGNGDMKKKKGLQWEVVPERKEAVNREVQMYESKMSNYKRSPAVYGQITNQCSLLLPKSIIFTSNPQGGLKHNNGNCILINQHREKMKNNLVQRNSSFQNIDARQYQKLVVSALSQVNQSTSNRLSRKIAADCLRMSDSTLPEDLADVQLACPFTGIGDSTGGSTPSKQKTVISDEAYIQNLLQAVDEAIRSECGPARTHDQILSLDEILQVLESVGVTPEGEELDFLKKRVERFGLKEKILSNSFLLDKELKRAMFSEYVKNYHIIPSKRTLISNTEEEDSRVELSLLSRSQERLLLNELERDAHKMATNLRSFLKHSGEGIYGCRCTCIGG